MARASSPGSDGVSSFNWTVAGLLGLSDSVRLSLAERKSFGPNTNRLAEFLEAALVGEASDVLHIDLETITEARLDKLLVEILNFAKPPFARQSQVHCIVASASSLQRLWRARGRAGYFAIDERRAHKLVHSGRLKDVRFTPPTSANSPSSHIWRCTHVDSSPDLEPNVQFDAGQ